MCGYAGFIRKNGANPSDDGNMLNDMGKLLFHRGPDEAGEYIGEGFGVTHRRLAIIDIAQGQQPMLSADGLVGIAFNGEIYNFGELRVELEAQGCKFHTHSDTEVFLSLFEVEGVDCFHRLDGMFTAFVWDFRTEAEGEFYLVRDHLGIKPLYLYEDGRRFVFSSELRPLVRQGALDLELDPVGIASYVTYRYCHAPHTFFTRIRRVEAGTYIRICRGHASTWRYWDLPTDVTVCTMSLDDAAAHLRHLLRDSVKRQQVSEVPVGLLLSGGLDSSVIAGLCSDVGATLLSFNIGFANLNEFAFSKDVAQRFNLPHVVIETSADEIAKRFDQVVFDMDEPIADPACFPLHILCDQIRQHVTVVLSGEGSDELLGGYPQYQRILSEPPASVDQKFETFRTYSWYFNGRRVPITTTVPEYKHWRHRQYFIERPMLEGMLAYDMKTWLPENLMAKADKILMSHSLEGRFPFLSTHIVEFCASLPDHYKLVGTEGKVILKKAFEHMLPPSVLSRPKMGFSVPVSDLLFQMREQLYDLLESSRNGKLEGLMDFGALRKEFDDYFVGRNSNALWVWTVSVLLNWFRMMESSSHQPAFESMGDRK